MPKVVVTAQVENVVKWEAGFRTHGDLFRNAYTVTTPVASVDTSKAAINRHLKTGHFGDGG